MKEFLKKLLSLFKGKTPSLSDAFEKIEKENKIAEEQFGGKFFPDDRE